MDRAPGLSVRLKLTISYAGFLMLAGALLLAVVWVFLLRDLPVIPGGVLERSVLLRTFVGRGCGAGVPAGVRSAGRVGSRRPDARPLARSPTPHAWLRTGRSPTGSSWKAAKTSSANSPTASTPCSHGSKHTSPNSLRFAANASHELRTPLAITQTLVDVARNDPNRDTGELVDRLHAVNTSDRPHRSIAPAQPCRPAFLHPRTCRPVPHRGRSHRNAPPSQKSGASPSRSPATSPPPSDHTRSCCR